MALFLHTIVMIVILQIVVAFIFLTIRGTIIPCRTAILFLSKVHLHQVTPLMYQHFFVCNYSGQTFDVFTACSAGYYGTTSCTKCPDNGNSIQGENMNITNCYNKRRRQRWNRFFYIYRLMLLF